MGSESRTGARPAIAVAAAGLIIAGCAASGAGSSISPSSSLRLVAYDDCGDLLSGLRKATAAHVGPYGLPGDPIMRPLAGDRVPGDAAPPAEAQHSTTNVQEPGVDEPDLVKTDGRRIVTFDHGKLRVVDAASRKQTGALTLAGGPGRVASGELLLSGDRVLVIMRPAMLYAGGIDAPRQRDSGPTVALVDIKGAPRLVASMRLDGMFVDARQNGPVARLVMRSTPHIGFPHGQGRTADTVAANRKVVERAPVDAWLPRYSVTRDGRTREEKVPCDQVSHPPSYTGTSLVSVLSLDLAGDLSNASPVSVVAGGETVYGSSDALYVTDRTNEGPQPPDAQTLRPVTSKTDIYRFDLAGPGRPRFTASGSIPGELLGPYALSEYGGNLRVATTTGQGPSSVSTVYVLGRHGARLDEVGRVGGLGRGEQLYAVRFIGPVGYVVTFRQTDPLYTLDLRDPAHPRTNGELKISGYSAYLHPAGDGRLIGVGQRTDAKGHPLGTKVSLFDVRDPAAPREIAGYRLGSGYSTAEFDPHAFLYWPQTGLTVLPSASLDGGALVLTVTSSGVTKAGEVRQPAGSGGVQRSVLVGDTLWTLSPNGLQANDVKSFTKSAWLPLS